MYMYGYIKVHVTISNSLDCLAKVTVGHSAVCVAFCMLGGIRKTDFSY